MKPDDTAGDNSTPLNEERADHLLEFLNHEDAEPAPEQVERDLRQRGVNLDRLFRNVMADVEQQAARRELERAKATRPSIIRNLQGIITETAKGVGVRVEELRERATALLSGPQQTAFFRDLEKVDSEEDLQSLLDDIAYLDALQDGVSGSSTDSDDSDKSGAGNK